MPATIKSNIEVIINEVKSIIRKDGTLWSAMVLHNVVDRNGYLIGVDTLKEMMKEEEKQVKQEFKVSLIDCGSYRSNKSIISRAIELGVALRNEDDTVRGKTEVEKELKELKTKETAFETIKRSCELIAKKLKEMEGDGNLSDVDVSVAFSLIKGNMDAVTQLAGKTLRKAA